MKLNEQSGQMIVESVLIMTMLVGFAFIVSSNMRSSETISKLVSGPWANLAGVIQNGAWGSPQSTMRRHPSNFEKKISLKGDTPE